ncbi:MAG: phosphoribosylglycinamide formyltransferase [Omnitrophica WOR_2 bacterium RIFCSPLOWO2_12_FULL_51_8]|nr:MAG: phosphoribosylglycinamide formyltransferase [Omnitrophica WOR_2 bacterium RIFCSPLOWO2_12_FULL_51_8]
MRIAVFASGRGTNFASIARAVKKGRVKAGLALLVCDNPRAGVLGRARRAGVKVALVERKDFSTKAEFENKIIQFLEEEKIDLIVLAGFMRILGPGLVAKYRNKIINIHPAILPCFKGAQAIKDAFDYGAKVTGVTVHFVDEKTDHGPIILQQAVKISPSDTLESLEAKIHKIEHRLYPRAVKLFVEGRLSLAGRQVKITAPEAPPAPPRGLK